ADQMRPMDEGNPSHPRRALVANLAGNGLIAHLAVENLAAVQEWQQRALRPKKAISPPAPTQYQVIRLGAPTLDALETKLRQIVESGRPETGTSAFAPTDRARLAAVGRDSADLLKKLSAAQG